MSAIITGVGAVQEVVFGTRLKELMEAKGYSCRYMASRTGLSESFFVKYTSGCTHRPRRDSITECARVLGVSVAYLSGCVEWDDVASIEVVNEVGGRDGNLPVEVRCRREGERVVFTLTIPVEPFGCFWDTLVA